MRRRVFFVSDRTGITAETLGETLLTQFPDVEFTRTNVPFVTGPDKARQALAQIQAAEAADGEPALVFSTLTDTESQVIIGSGLRHVFDLFGTYIDPLERALGVASSHTAGRMHGLNDHDAYDRRVEALNYTLDHDDGLNPKEYDQADVILIGVSRSGKTPTCLYMAMHLHLKCANYPLNDEDLQYPTLPAALRRLRSRIFGLTIDPEQLSRIRNGRRPGSRYASVEQCRLELQGAQRMYYNEGIASLDTTAVSIEEIATTIHQHFGFERPFR
ncbi:MAG: pyruvate, water dikinase regulatory protein [Gammaproteobacteria bacterium]